MTGSGRADRVGGTLLAAACGDALGVPYEAGSRPLPGSGERPRMLGGGLGGYAPGEYSDDTQMAVVIAQAAAAGDLLDEAVLDQIVDGWITWLQRGASDVGAQTRRVLADAARARGRPAARARAAAATLHEQTGRTAGNGSLMRTAPVALGMLGRPWSELTAAARAVSDLTHPDPLAGDACVLWCAAITVAIEHQHLALEPGLDLIPASRRDRWAGWLVEAEEVAPGRFAGGNGYAPVALQAAWSAITTTATDVDEDPRTELAEGIVAAVLGGGDTDTVAAITGALLGARWGADAVPSDWRADVHGWPRLRAEQLVGLGRSAAHLESAS